MELRIRKEDFARALDIFNYLHTDEMLLRHARGGSFGRIEHLPLSKTKWYSWVQNPENPYETLEEAFKNWHLVNPSQFARTDDHFIVRGSYNNKLGQQEFLLEELAPVLEDTQIHVKGEDGAESDWIIKDHAFKSVARDQAGSEPEK